MRTFAAVAIAACLAACTREQTAPEASAPAANALTTHGWGPLRIGMTLAEVTAALGEDADPEAVGGLEPEVCDEFRPQRAPEGMLVMIEDGVLTRITLTEGSLVRTDRALGVGDAADAIKTAYGDDLVVNPHFYLGLPAEYLAAWDNAAPGPGEYVQDANARGIVYETDLDGVVQVIHAGGPSIQYVEGCA